MAINEIYRSTYTGNDEILGLVYRSGKWVVNRTQQPVTDNEWPASGRCAVVFGNGVSRQKFNPELLVNRPVAAIPSKVLRTYGCNAIHRDFIPDFLVASNKDMLDEIDQTGAFYRTKLFVPTNLKCTHALYHNIPQDPKWNAGTVATYLAAFDEHRKVFLLGFDGIDDPNASYNIYEGTNGYPSAPYSEEFWVKSMSEVFNTYPNTEFVRVMPEVTARVPELWKYSPNFRQINYNQFVIEADL